MNRREFGKKSVLVTGAVALSGVDLVMLTGCDAQDTLAGLATTLGNAAASLASDLGNTTLANEILASAAKVSAAIAAWTPGDTATLISEAITVLQNNLDLIPAVTPYVGLVDIALSAIQSIIAWVSPKVVSMSLKVPKTVRVLTYTGKPIKDARTFKAAWNKQAALDPKTVSLEIK
jgi:hypothetical protein